MRCLQIAIAMLLASFSVFAADQPKKPDTLQLQLEVGWGFNLSTNPASAFTNIPASYRTVPWHPDDDSTGQRTTLIPDSTLNPTSLYLMNYRGSVGLMFKERIALRADIGLCSNALDQRLSPGNTGKIREVDIGSGTFIRGYGTSLVYNAVKFDSIAPRVYLFPEAEVRIGPVGLVVGGWQRSYNYIIERGWDRYDALQTLDQLPFASEVMTHYYAGIRFAYLGYWDKNSDYNTVFGGALFTVGPVKIRNTFAPQAQGAQLQGGSGVMFDLTFVIGGPVKRWGTHK